MDAVVSLLAILSISLFFVVRFRLNAAVAPFFSIALITVCQCLFSMVGLVELPVFLALAFALFCLIWVFVVKRTPLRDIAAVFLSPGLVFFVVAALFFLVALSVRQPHFVWWDEFSFWGTAPKILCDYRQLYTTFAISTNNSYPPALPLWSFFVQFVGGGFVEWKVYFAYDLLMMSVMAMLFARLKWKNTGAVVLLAFFGLAAPYLFYLAFENTVFYISAYADLPIGLIFGGALLGYFMAGDNKILRWALPLAGIALLGFTKDIGMPLGLVVAVVVSADMLLHKDYPLENRLDQKKALRLLFPLALFAAAALPYLLWTVYYGTVSVIARTPVPYDYTLMEMLSGRDPYFNEMLRRMTDALFTNRVLSFCSVFAMVLLLTLAPIAVAALSRDKKKLARVAVTAVLLAAGFFAYYYFHAYLYTTVFTGSRQYDMHSYSRYMSSYAAGWLIAVVGLCFSALALPKFKKFRLLPAAALTLALLCVGLFAIPADAQVRSFLSPQVDTGLSPIRREMRQSLDRFDGTFGQDDRFYFVCQQSNGGEWFLFNYENLPAYTVVTQGGGNYVSPETPATEMGPYDVAADAADFVAYLRQEGVDYVYVYNIDNYFFDAMSQLFDDRLSGAIDRSGPLYRVVDNGGDDFHLVPVQNAQQLTAAA